MIKINKLNKYYNKGKPNQLHVINNTSLELGDSGLVCILGESGSGKTTLLNTVGGLDTFQSGRITIDEVSLTKYAPKTMEKLRNSRFAYIFQEQYLLQEYSVAYNLKLALNMYELSEQEKEERLDYVLEAVEMKKFKKRLVSQLSGGQQQRVAIARALIKSPDIIFADEPTGNLDEANTMRVMSIIKKISKDCLVILVTHEKRIAEFFADRIILIEDGKIVSDFGHEGKNTYRFSDDTKLYLKEFEHATIDDENIRIDFYHQGEPSGIKLNMVYSEGKLYIQTMEEAKVVYLNSTTEMQMVDDVKPVYEKKQLEEVDYALSKLETVRESRLSFLEIYQLAKTNVAKLGKKQIFMIATFVITALLLVYALQVYFTAASVDKETFITADSHYLFINAKRNSSANNEQYYDSFNEIYRQFADSNLAEDIYIDLNAKLSFNYGSFGQIARKQNTLGEASYVTLDHLKPTDLVLGRMPESRYEIVVDQWIINAFLKQDEVMNNIMSEKDFIDLSLMSDYYGTYVKVVGICNTGEPTIYVDKYLGISMASWADSIASLNQLQHDYPGWYDDLKLGEGEVMVSERTFQDMVLKGDFTFTAKNGREYQAIGSFPDYYGVTYVVNDAYYSEILDSYICTNRKFMIYGEDNQASKDYFALESGNYNSAYVEMLVSDSYEEQMTEFYESRSVQLNAQFIATIIIFAISVLMLYFTMKSNAINRAQELTVYRLVGITARSILSAFVLEVVMITTYTMLPAVLIFSGIIKFIAVIPALQTDIVYPWSAVFGLLLFLYSVNIVVGMLPVYTIVKLPPAQLADKAG